jgi:hypothetical protein
MTRATSHAIGIQPNLMLYIAKGGTTIEFHKKHLVEATCVCQCGGVDFPNRQ